MSIEGARFKENQNKKQSIDLEEPGENHVMDTKGTEFFRTTGWASQFSEAGREEAELLGCITVSGCAGIHRW